LNQMGQVSESPDHVRVKSRRYAKYLFFYFL
jgi:hypothetical protein